MHKKKHYDNGYGANLVSVLYEDDVCKLIYFSGQMTYSCRPIAINVTLSTAVSECSACSDGLHRGGSYMSTHVCLI